MAGECLSSLTEGDGEAERVADQALEEQVGATPIALYGETEASTVVTKYVTSPHRNGILLPRMLQMVQINSTFS